MELYINKEDIVKELKERSKLYGYGSSLEAVYKKQECDDILSFLDTLEIKEVDLEEEFDNYTKNILACDVQFEPFTHLYNCAKYFYESTGYYNALDEVSSFLNTLEVKDVDEIIKNTEDHAYFAGSENTREKLIDKACKWWEDELSYPSMTPEEIKWYKSKVRKFRKAMEDET